VVIFSSGFIFTSGNMIICVNRRASVTVYVKERVDLTVTLSEVIIDMCFWMSEPQGVLISPVF